MVLDNGGEFYDNTDVVVVVMTDDDDAVVMKKIMLTVAFNNTVVPPFISPQPHHDFYAEINRHLSFVGSGAAGAGPPYVFSVLLFFVR